MNKSKVIWGKADPFLVTIRQVAAVICNCEFLPGVPPPNLPFPCGLRDHHLTQCVNRFHKCTSQMASKSGEPFKHGAHSTICAATVLLVFHFPAYMFIACFCLRCDTDDRRQTTDHLWRNVSLQAESLALERFH